MPSFRSCSGTVLALSGRSAVLSFKRMASDYAEFYKVDIVMLEVGVKVTVEVLLSRIAESKGKYR